jgi:inner membrane protein
MIVGIVWSAMHWRSGASHPERPAQIAGAIMLAYIAFNLGESVYVEDAAANALRRRGAEPALVVASPPPLAFWDRAILWRSADRFGSGSFDFGSGLVFESASQPLRLDDPRLATAEAQSRHVRSFLVWSRMPIVVDVDGRAYLSDQRFYGPLSGKAVPKRIRDFFRAHSFLIPLDNGPSSS